MLIVARMNVVPMLGAYKQVFEANPAEAAKQKYNLGTREGFLAYLCNLYGETTANRISKNFNLSLTEAKERVEITKRRTAWFAQATLIVHADELSKANPLCHDTLAEIWIHIARNSANFYGALEYNILWSDNEIQWFGNSVDKFSEIKGSKAALDFCARIMPRYLHKRENMQSFLKEKDNFWY
jgi:hypothetical protein